MKKLILIIIIGLLFVGSIAYRFSARKATEEIRSISQIQKEVGVPVDVVVVEKQDLRVTRQFTGTVEGILQSYVNPKISEKIVKVNAKEGDYVKMGQVIAELDQGSVNARYQQSRSAYENAKKDYQRMQALREAGAISDQTLDQVKTSYEVAKANFEAAASLLDLTAPISGVLTSLGVDIGDITVPGEPIATIAQIDRVKVVLQVSEIMVGQLKIGQEATISIDADPGHQIHGTVTRIALSADPKTRNFEVQVEADNPQLLLKPGNFATVEIAISSKKQALAIPKDALTEREGNTIVYVVDAEGKAEIRPVEKGISNGILTEILDGLAEGDRVIVNGFNDLLGGEKVKVRHER
ncbi:MAG: efflux RND transporter periplasmic adaptor subunit [bacterium]